MKRFAHLLLIAMLTLFVQIASAAETVIETAMKAKTKLPFGGAQQVSGLKVDLGPDGSFIAPDQVCTLVFAKAADQAIVRVWHNSENKRYFVSTAGDDANPGTEEKPWKSLGLAVKNLMAKDRADDIYVAGGDYWLDDEPLVMRFNVSIFGGFDGKTWRRDPTITESVLLPNGFRENWIDDMSPRFKDLRRAEHRVNETRLWRTYGEKASYTLSASPNEGPGKEGTPDVYLDGVTAFGCQTMVGRPEPSLVYVSSVNQRTIRNCMFLQGWAVGHAFLPGSGGRGLYENNILWGGMMGHKGHARPQMVFRHGATMRRNLHCGSTGGDYDRMFLCWEEGGTVEESQIHTGNTLEWSTFIQGYHGAVKAKKDYVFTRNLVWAENLARPWAAAGLVLKDNTFFLRDAGFTTLLATRTLTITGNTFNLMAKANRENLFPAGADMTHKLGGTITFEGEKKKAVLHEPQGEGDGKPTIENNKIEQLPADLGRRPRDYVNVARLLELVDDPAVGEEASIRPAPASGLKAEVIAGEVRLSWTASPDPNVVGYRVYYGPVTNSYAHTLVVDAKNSATVSDLKPGVWFFSVAAHKDAFVEAWKFTNEVEVKVGP